MCCLVSMTAAWPSQRTNDSLTLLNKIHYEYFIFFLVRAENTQRLLGCSSQYWQFYPADSLFACFIQSHCLLDQYQHKTNQLYTRHNVNHRQQSRFLTQQCLHKTNQPLPWLLSLLKQQLEIKGFLPPLHNTKQAWK